MKHTTLSQATDQVLWLPTKDRIITLRKRLGLSQAALGILIGVSVTTVNRWESGRVSPKSGAVLAIIAKLERRERQRR